MSNPDFELGVSYARDLTFDIDGRVNNSGLANSLRRGISGVADFFIANDFPMALDRLVSKYGIDFSIVPSIRPDITFHPTVDGGKTADALREKGIVVPKYIEDIVLCGKIREDLPAGRFTIFDVGDDLNAAFYYDSSDDARKELPTYRKKLTLPITYIVERWNFNQFERPGEIQEKLRQSLLTQSSDPIEAMYASYNASLAYEAYRLMNTQGVVKNLFGDNEWRENAIGYGRALLKAAMKSLEKQIAKGVENEKEFVERLNRLFVYYLQRITQ